MVELVFGFPLFFPLLPVPGLGGKFDYHMNFFAVLVVLFRHIFFFSVSLTLCCIRIEGGAVVCVMGLVRTM